MVKAKEELLTQKEISALVGCGIRAVQKLRKEFNLRPVDWTGVTPLFRLADVEKMRDARRKKRLARIERLRFPAPKERVISTAQARLKAQAVVL